MKKMISIFLTVIMCLFCVACSQKDDAENTPLSVENSSGIVGVWTLEISETKQSRSPLTGTLVTVLCGYLKDASQIEFKDNGKAEVNGKEIDYILEDKQLTLVWDGVQNFVFDVSGDNEGIDLDYNRVIGIKLKKQQ